MKTENNIAKGLTKKSCCMMGIYHCFALAFAEHVDLDAYIFLKMTWKKFQRINKKKKQRYSDHKGGWFYDDWLLKKVKYAVYSFGYYLKDCDVFMPEKMLPLVIKINPMHRKDRAICILIAPRGETEDASF